MLYDLEFLADPASGKRVAAFGYHAGYAGAALALLAWSHQLLHPGTPFPSISSYPDERKLIADVRQAVEKGKSLEGGRAPRVLVIGALGRCGGGAVDLCRAVGLAEDNILKWDLAETKAGGPLEEIAKADVFVNCILLTETRIPPFVTPDLLAKPGRKLSVLCDVSCDPNNPALNPVPIVSAFSVLMTSSLSTLVLRMDYVR